MQARLEASAELTLHCAAAAGMLQEVPGRSVLCEIPWRLSRWLERFVVLPLYFTRPLYSLQTASNLFRTSPSLQKPKCFHTLDHSGGLIISRSLASPLPSAMLCFVFFALLLARGNDVTYRQTESSNV